VVVVVAPACFVDVVAADRTHPGDGSPLLMAGARGGGGGRRGRREEGEQEAWEWRGRRGEDERREMRFGTDQILLKLRSRRKKET